VLRLVVARNGDIDVLERRIAVAESDRGDVYVRRFLEGLVISSGVRENQQSGFQESGLDLIGKCTGGVSSSQRGSSSEVSEFQNGSLSIRSSRNDANVLRMLN